MTSSIGPTKASPTKVPTLSWSVVGRLIAILLFSRLSYSAWINIPSNDRIADLPSESRPIPSTYEQLQHRLSWDRALMRQIPTDLVAYFDVCMRATLDNARFMPRSQADALVQQSRRNFEAIHCGRYGCSYAPHDSNSLGASEDFILNGPCLYSTDNLLASIQRTEQRLSIHSSERTTNIAIMLLFFLGNLAIACSLVLRPGPIPSWQEDPTLDPYQSVLFHRNTSFALGLGAIFLMLDAYSFSRPKPIAIVLSNLVWIGIVGYAAFLRLRIAQEQADSAPEIRIAHLAEIGLLETQTARHTLSLSIAHDCKYLEALESSGADSNECEAIRARIAETRAKLEVLCDAPSASIAALLKELRAKRQQLKILLTNKASNDAVSGLRKAIDATTEQLSHFATQRTFETSIPKLLNIALGLAGAMLLIVAAGTHGWFSYTQRSDSGADLESSVETVIVGLNEAEVCARVMNAEPRSTVRCERVQLNQLDNLSTEGTRSRYGYEFRNRMYTSFSESGSKARSQLFWLAVAVAAAWLVIALRFKFRPERLALIAVTGCSLLPLVNSLEFLSALPGDIESLHISWSPWAMLLGYIALWTGCLRLLRAEALERSISSSQYLKNLVRSKPAGE